MKNKRKLPRTYKGRATQKQKHKEKLKIQYAIIMVALLTGVMSVTSLNAQSHTSPSPRVNVPKEVLPSAEDKKPTQEQTRGNKEELSVNRETKGTIREVTAYNAGDPLQCDNTPCISANGENICTSLALGYKRCATNAFPFGTRLHIQNYGECLVVDRMNSRYRNRIDIAMTADEKARAINFGLQNLRVYVVN